MCGSSYHRNLGFSVHLPLWWEALETNLLSIFLHFHIFLKTANISNPLAKMVNIADEFINPPPLSSVQISVTVFHSV